MERESRNRRSRTPVTTRGRDSTLSLACAPPPGGDWGLRHEDRAFRFRVLIVLHVLGAARSAYSVLPAGLHGALPDAPVETLVGFAYVANLFYILASHDLKTGVLAGLAITAIGILQAATEAGVSALLWLYTLPPLSFLLLGLCTGIIFNAVVVLATAALFLLDETGTVQSGRPGLDILWGYAVAASLACVNEIRSDRRVRALEEQSVTDVLTGALNRRRYRELLELEIRRAQRHGKGPAVVMCDIDHFKRINDRFGHHAGDDVLRHVARVVRAHVRQTDSLVRLGGDEFLIIAPETAAGAALWLAEKLRAALKPSRVRDLPVTVCMGVAQWRRGEDAAALLARADRALYRAKAGGRDRVACDPAEPAGRARMSAGQRRAAGG